MLQSTISQDGFVFAVELRLDGDTAVPTLKNKNARVHITTSKQLLFKCFFSAIEDAFLKLRSVLRGLFQSFLTDDIFVSTNARPFNILTELTAWLTLLCHACKKKRKLKKKTPNLCPVVS